MERKRLTPTQARLNAQQYCSYQERSHQEVKDRLFGFGLREDEVESVLAELISENFLNEERFARAFARGKFRMKGWGKKKIRYELKQKRVSEYCIKKGLSEIDEDEYAATLKKMFEAKWDALKGEKNIYIKKRKLLDFLLQKGYEPDLISNFLNDK